MIVIDASLAIEVLIRTPLGLRQKGVFLGEDLHAPDLIDIEVMNAIRRLSLRRGITPDVADDALQDLKHLRLQRYGHLPLVDRIWGLRNAVSVYDAAYVALAEFLDVPLLTCDARLSRSHGHDAQIVLVR